MGSAPTPGPSSRREARVTRLFRAPRELVFNAWIDPDNVAAWWAPKEYAIPRETVEIDPRPGGRIHFSMIELATGAVDPVRFTIRELSQPELLVLASDPKPEIGLPYPMITRVVFETHEEGTLVTVTQGPHTQDGQERASTGWFEALEKLDLLLRPERPGAAR